MQRCLDLAKNGLGNTYPNPMVGAVIVYDGKIIGEGYHTKAGEAHAEVNAVNSVANKTLLRDATLYVNLEPCSHFGRTPPCSKLIIEQKIPRVVIGCVDSFSEVSGRGIKMLRAAGVNVEVGVLEAESRDLNVRFFTFHEKKRPYVILKWAQTMDGFIDISREAEDFGEPTWITNDVAKMVVHKWRSEEQAILVGSNTAVKDNPSLTVREWVGPNPLRVLIDRRGRVAPSQSLFDGSTPTVVFSESNQAHHKNVTLVGVDFSKGILEQVFSELYLRGCQSVIIEGGATVLNACISQGLWDEARVFVGQKWFYDGVRAPKLSSREVCHGVFGDSALYVYRNNLLF